MASKPTDFILGNIDTLPPNQSFPLRQNRSVQGDSAPLAMAASSMDVSGSQGLPGSLMEVQQAVMANGVLIQDLSLSLQHWLSEFGPKMWRSQEEFQNCIDAKLDGQRRDYQHALDDFLKQFALSNAGRIALNNSERKPAEAAAPNQVSNGAAIKQEVDIDAVLPPQAVTWPLAALPEVQVAAPLQKLEPNFSVPLQDVTSMIPERKKLVSQKGLQAQRDNFALHVKILTRARQQGHLAYYVKKYIPGLAFFLNWVSRHSKDVVDVKEELERSTFRRVVRRMVDSLAFETMSVAVITLNVVSIGIRADYQIRGVKNEDMDLRREHAKIIEDVDFGCLVYFCVEIALRCIAQGVRFFAGTPWLANQLDVFVVVMSFLSIHGHSMINLSVLRALRLLNAIAQLRVFRQATVFLELYMLIKNTLRCFRALLWSVAFLVFIIFLTSVASLDAIINHAVLTDPSTRDFVVKHYGSLQVAMTTMLTMVVSGVPLDNFEEHDLVMVKLMTVSVITFVLMCLTPIVLATCAGLTLNSQAHDTSLKRQCMLDNGKAFHEELATRCEAHGYESTRKLEVEDFEELLQLKPVQAFMFAQGIELKAEQIFRICDDHDTGVITVEDFISACQWLAGSTKATSFVLLSEQMDYVCREVQRCLDCTRSLGHQLQRAHLFQGGSVDTQDEGTRQDDLGTISKHFHHLMSEFTAVRADTRSLGHLVTARLALDSSKSNAAEPRTAPPAGVAPSMTSGYFSNGSPPVP